MHRNIVVEKGPDFITHIHVSLAPVE